MEENKVILDESTLNRLVSGHDKDGYVIISASRGDKTAEENNKRFSELKSKVNKYGYSYIPVFGGYKEEDNGEVLEKSLFVLPYNRVLGTKVEPEYFDDFLSSMIDLGKYYNQDSILVKTPTDKPKYLDLSTMEYDKPFDGELKLNDIAQVYFTSMKKWNTDKYGDTIKGKPQRFTYTQTENLTNVYLMEQPKTINEAHRRSLLGEIIYYDKK